MFVISTRTRISIGLVCLTITVLLSSMWLGILPDSDRAILDGRRALCEAIAVNSSNLVSQGDLARLKLDLTMAASRNPEILSAGLRTADGALLVEIGGHRAAWRSLADERSTDSQVQVPIRAGQELWGCVEIRFRPISPGGVRGLLWSPRARLLWFVGGISFFLYLLYMAKMLEYLDPSQSVPTHVRSALDALAEGLLVIDARDRIALANGAIAALLGESADKLVGHVASRLPWIREEPTDTSSALPWVVALREKTAKTNSMLRLKTASGEVRSFLVNSSPVLGHRGEYRGVLVSFDDVTDLEEKERELRGAKDAADAANRTKSDFLANMSHEIRTPMNSILGFADVLRRGLATSDAEIRRFLDTIHSSGKHLLELINDILDISKIEAGRMEVELVPVDPLRLISELVGMFSVPASERGLFIDCAAEGRVPKAIRSDATRLRQILTNLIGNALKFTEKGGIRLVARLVSHEGAARFAIDVIDTGIGIPPQALNKIFEAFVQADSTVTRKFGGTGLGLAISRRFAAALGGDLTVTSVPGNGSTFCVTIDPGPLADDDLIDGSMAFAEDEPSAAAASAPLLRLVPARVLVADDGEANCHLLQVVLGRAGMQVECVGDGSAAVKAVEKGRFDIVLMDMQMPVLDGYSATRRLRWLGHDIPIVALTANAMKGDEEKCRQAGCSAFIAKPIDIDKLLECLARELNGRAIAPMGADEATTNQTDLIDPENLRNQLDDLHAAWQKGDFERLKNLSHEIRSAASGLGDDATASIAGGLEELACRPANARMDTEIEAALDDLAVRIESLAMLSADRICDAALSDGSARLAASPVAKPGALTCSLPLDDPAFRPIIEGFVERLNEQMQVALSASTGRDFPEVARIAHWLKGSGGTLGFGALTEPASVLERAAKQGLADQVEESLDDILGLVASIDLSITKQASGS